MAAVREGERGRDADDPGADHDHLLQPRGRQGSVRENFFREGRGRPWQPTSTTPLVGPPGKRSPLTYHVCCRTSTAAELMPHMCCRWRNRVTATPTQPQK